MREDGEHRTEYMKRNEEIGRAGINVVVYAGFNVTAQKTSE